MPQKKAFISIAELFQGTSEQSDAKRRPGQVEEANNLRLDPADGARKRSGTRFIADLNGFSGGWAWTSLNEFVVRAQDGLVEVYNRNGESQAVTIEDSANLYLSGAGYEDIQLVPYLNSVLLLNRTKTVLTETTPTYAIAGEQDVFTELEGVTTPSGAVWQVLQTEAENPAGYYQATANNPTLLQWTRVAGPSDVDGRYDRTTMPIQLVHSGGAFTLRYLTWEDRKSGNGVTNAMMPWAGSTIKSLAVWNSRLCLMGSESFTTSETLSSQQEGFNLWRDDVATPVDTDPIVLYFDLPNIGSPLRSAVLGRDLLVACENGQMAVTSGDQPPSPNKFNVAMRQVSSFKSLNIPLRPNGEETVLVDQNGQVHLYAYQGVVNGIQKVLTLNEHRKNILRDYEVADAFQLGQAVFIPDRMSARVAVHDRYVAGGQVAQLAWSEYTFDRAIAYMDQYGSNQFIVTEDLASTAASSICLYDHENIKEWYINDWQVHLDRMHEPTVSYNSTDNETLVQLQGVASDNVYVVDISDDTPRVLRPIRTSGTWVYVRGNLTNRTVIAGWAYESSLVLSKLWVGNAATMLERLTVFYANSTDFAVKIGAPGQTRQTAFVFQSSLPTSANSETGSVDCTVLGDGRIMEIELVNNSPGTATFSALQYAVNAMEA